MTIINESLANKLYTEYFQITESYLVSGQDIPEYFNWMYYLSSKGFSIDESETLNNLVTVEF